MSCLHPALDGGADSAGCCPEQEGLGLQQRPTCFSDLLVLPAWSGPPTLSLALPLESPTKGALILVFHLISGFYFMLMLFLKCQTVYSLNLSGN